MATHDKSVTILGSKESIDFPDLGLFGVPAKVDTGADSSAIWASDIYEKDGTLYYTLFDKVAPFYTGDVLTTKKFSVASIKNSFGHTEFRYKVTLKVRLGGRVIRIRFTLANRENNSQPILIGRRTLHGKFLVDVARTDDNGPQRLLLMSTFISPNVAAFVKGVEQAAQNLEVVHTTYDDVQFSFDPCGTKITLISTGDDIASFDIVHFKTSGERDVTAAMARYLKKRGVKIVDESTLHFAPSSKLYQYVILADNDVDLPQSLYLAPSRLEGAYATFVAHLGSPFVLKGIHASRGDHNYMIRSVEEYEDACRQVLADGVFVVGQTYVPNTGDYRILVMGRRISLIIHRSRSHNGTHLNNTSQGSTAKLVDISELPTAVQTTSIIAAKVLDHGVAGVDMVQNSETGHWYCFEVNSGPQIASGAFTTEKQQAFAKFIETELSK
jgi:glutathione synthase/RimK-type ligase-like ATP-grasp enzyme